MQQCRYNLENIQLLLGVKTHHLHRRLEFSVGVLVMHAISSMVGAGRGTSHHKVLWGCVVNHQLLLVGRRRTGQQLVEDVVVALAVGVGYETDLLQQVGFDAGTDESTGVAKVDFNKLAKAGGVVCRWDRKVVWEGHRNY